MAILERALSKLTLEAFQDRERRKSIGSITAMYNPTSVELSYTADYDPYSFLNTHWQSNRYQQVRPGELSLELVLDARLPGNRQSVDGQLSKLRALCFDIDGKTGEPNFLRIRWGRMNWHGHGYFAGRVTSLAVSYTLFDRDATPQRATAQLTLSADESLLIQQSQNGVRNQAMLKAPARDPLPLMAATASASLAVGQVDYLSLAYDNDLDHFSSIQPGRTLVFGLGKE